MKQRLLAFDFWRAVLPVALAAYAIANPVGNFPLNDDWAWSRDVMNVLGGNWSYTGWESMPLLPQILWGALVSKIFGFDFTILRLSVLFLSLVELYFFHKIARLVSGDGAVATALTLLFLFNPLQFALANTFMTDVPFLALALSALYYFLRRLRDGKDADLWTGLALCCVAALQRQFAILISLAFAAGLAYKEGLSRKNAAKLLIAGFAPLLVLSSYEFVLLAFQKTPLLYFSKQDELAQLGALGVQVLAARLVSRFALILCTCGAFFLPVFFLPRFTGKNILKSPSFYVCLAALAAVRFSFLRGAPLPFTGNILNPEGVGPLLLKDAYILGTSGLPVFPPLVLQAASAASLAGGAGLLRHLAAGIWDLFARRERTFRQAAFLTGLLFFLAYALISSVFAGFYDRYVLVACAFVPLLAVSSPAAPVKRFPFVPILLWTLLLAVFSTGLTHDYLAWNRSKWEAIAYLENERNVLPQSMDGGFEYNAMRFFVPVIMRQEGKSWWWVIDDAYLVAFSPVPGYETLKEFPYSRWMFPGQGRILALARRP